MPRRLLLLITDLEIGGTPTVVRELAVRLRDPGQVHVEVACLKSGGPVADQLEAAGIHVTAFDARGAADFPRTVHRLDQLLGGRLIDTCFSFLFHANAIAAVSSLFMHEVRYFQSIQTTQPDPRWHWTAHRLVHRAARAMVVPSRSVADAAGARSGIPAEKLVVIPNAVDVDAFPVRPAPAFRGKYSVGFLGRLDPVKRVPDLVRAVEILGTEYQLHVVGEGADRPAVEREIAQTGTGGRVVLHGAVARPQVALREMDVLVLPSEAEGFGLVLIEAMAAGVPVVATDVPGIRDVVRDGFNGLLVPVGAADRIADAVRRIRSDDTFRAGLVERARADVVQRFSWPSVLRQYRRVLGLPDPEDSSQ